MSAPIEVLVQVARTVTSYHWSCRLRLSVSVLMIGDRGRSLDVPTLRRLNLRHVLWSRWVLRSLIRGDLLCGLQVLMLRKREP